jgi:HSP20 family molecular chaperone IbpA
MSGGELDLGYEDGRLVIAGSRFEPGGMSGGQCALKEIASGYFRVEVDVPWRVDSHAVRAAYRDGFLTVELPRVRDQAKIG